MNGWKERWIDEWRNGIDGLRDGWMDVIASSNVIFQYHFLFFKFLIFYVSIFIFSDVLLVIFQLPSFKLTNTRMSTDI
jgi:hypothetical protein